MQRAVLLLGALVMAASCGSETAGPAVPRLPTENPQGPMDDPVAALVRPSPAADASFCGCYHLKLKGPTTGWAALPTRLQLMSEQKEMPSAPGKTYYRARALDATPRDRRWQWLMTDQSHIEVQLSDGFVGWVLELETAGVNLKGSATPFQDAGPTEGAPAPVVLVRVTCE